MPQGIENVLRFEAPRQKERGHGINKKASNGMVENVSFTEGKKEAAVDCALENPTVFTPTAVDEELTMTGPPCLFPKYTKNSLTGKN